MNKPVRTSEADSAPIYEDIKERLRAQLGRQWPVGTRLPPIKSLARQMGMGQSNTHRAIKELVEEGQLVSRPGRGTFVADPAAAPPPAAARARGVLTGQTIKVVRWNFDKLIDTAVTAAGAELQLMGAKVENEYIDNTIKGPGPVFQADGYVLVHPVGRVPIDRRPEAMAVIVTSSMEASMPAMPHVDQALADSEQGGFLAGQWLAKIGCKSVCYIGRTVKGPPVIYDKTSTARLEGFLRGWGRDIPQHLRIRTTHYSAENGARMLSDYLALSPRPEAVFCASDGLAVGFVHGGLAHGLEVGRDYLIVGFEGQFRGRQLQVGPLTTVDAPMARLGRAGARLLADRFADPDQPNRRMYIGCSLFEGQTAIRPIKS